MMNSYLNEHLIAKTLFKEQEGNIYKFLFSFAYPWEALPFIQSFIEKESKNLSDDFIEYDNNVWIHKSAKITKTAFIGANTIIGANTEVRHCAFIRGNVYIGDNCVIGNSCEIKNSVLLNGAQTPHFNYVGDSVLGHRAHLGAGVITSNVKGNNSLVSVKYGYETIATKLKKFGAILGDNAEIGCNAVLNPGTVLGKNTQIYPLTMVRGYIKEGCILKNNGDLIKKDI